MQPPYLYTLSLHDALPIFHAHRAHGSEVHSREWTAAAVDAEGSDAERPRRHRFRAGVPRQHPEHRDRKSTRLNSSHTVISYAVFCLKKKKLSLRLMLNDAK